MTTDQTIDTVLAVLSIGLLVLGLGSMLLGWLLGQWDRVVNRSQVAPSPVAAQTDRQTQTDETDRRVSVADQWLDRLEVDRTKTTLIELMVYSGWQVGEIRSVIRGDNGVIGAEIDAAKKRLGIVDEPRVLRVRDTAGERVIPY